MVLLSIDMGDFQFFWESVGGYKYFLITWMLLFLVHVCYVIYRAVVILHEEVWQEEGRSGEGVSVIITAHNRARSLRENLIGFLTQDHEQYEVIVVDECSEDETGEMLLEMQREYPRLKCTRIHPETKFRFTKKLAINIGILSARHDILLFSEANCYPASSSWVRAMQSCFTGDTTVVIGFSNFREEGSSFAWRRYFRFTRFLELLLLVRARKMVLGDGCNMGYRKSCYMRNKGFAGNTQSYLGYDHDMVRELSRYGKVKVARSAESYMHVDRDEGTTDDTSCYFASRARLPLGTRLRAGIDAGIRLSVYLLSLLLICSGILPVHASIVIVTVFTLDVISMHVFARHFNQQRLLLTSLVVNVVGFVYRWYWNGYSFFNPKKWR